MTHAAAIAAPRFLPESLTPHALGALRIVTAFLFVQHATAKLFHVPHVAAFDALPVLSFFAMLFPFIFLLLATTGAGAWSIDSRRSTRSRP